MNAVMTIEGAVDTPVFRAYVKHVLVLTLRAGDVVVMVNLSVHKAADIESLITGAGAQLIYLPPYSPDWSLIEHWWSKLKTWLRSMKARTREALDLALTKAIGKIRGACLPTACRLIARSPLASHMRKCREFSVSDMEGFWNDAGARFMCALPSISTACELRFRCHVTGCVAFWPVSVFFSAITSIPAWRTSSMR